MNEPSTALPIPVMDFDPVPFDEATAMLNDDEKYKYIRCLRFYWYHTKVTGIPNDDEGLRQLCLCEITKWKRLKGMLFDGERFFYLEDGKWHQKRARANYLKKQSDLVKKQNQTLPARQARWPDTVTESVQTLSGAQLIATETALKRVEARIKTLNGQKPFNAKEQHKLTELNELKTERTNLLKKLNWKA